MDVLFNDHDLLVVNKPSGLLSVPGKGPDKQDCVWTRLQVLHPSALVVHRLDQATSGLMVFALNPQTQRALSMAFEARLVDKQYLAWVEGVLPVSDDWQTIDLPILLDWPNRPVHIIDATGKPWTVEAHIEVGSFVRPLEDHIKDNNFRTMIFRFDDPAIAKKAADYAFKLIKGQRARAQKAAV